MEGWLTCRVRFTWEFPFDTEPLAINKTHQKQDNSVASITRLSLYALISAIEVDLRNTLSTYLSGTGPATAILGEQLFKKIADRSEQEIPQSAVNASIEDLILYCDYGDIIQLAKTHKNRIPESLSIQLKKLDSELTELIGTRNRVMHSRPLDYDDLAKTTELCEHLLSHPSTWPNLKDIKRKLSTEPDYILRLSIPFESDTSPISHNLPLPDFDETGFIGRRTTSTNLKKAILGVYPVVTIVGEGGLGKTSLALKVAYELLDQSQGIFDAIIFTSAKTHKLTDNEIQRIKGAINSSVGLIENAARSLGGDVSRSTNDLIELMSQFRVLLIIDNLETIIDENMRELLERIPAGSKILITTRIRMGAFEFPIQLDPLTSPEATQLLRATAKVRECGRLVAMPDVKLAEYCKKMRNNPLHIKWFVSAVQAGQRPESVLADEKIFLQFCLSNVFNIISDDGRKLVRTILSLGGSYTVAELSFLTSMDQTTLFKAIGELTRTNMFFSISTPTDASFETKYELSQLARAYLSRFYPVSKEEQQRLLQHKQKLISAGEKIRSETGRNPLSSSSIHCRTRSDWVIAKYLRDALAHIRAEEIEKAFDLIEQAKSLTPDFSEVHRIEAFAYARSGNITNAYDSYERALEFAPNSAVTRLLFGGFLLREVSDTEGAIDQFVKAIELCPEQPEPKIEYARACLFLRQFEKAETAIAELESLPTQHELTVKKVIDIHLQLLTRKADHYSSTQEPLRALEELFKVKEFYTGIAAPDSRMLERIVKIRGTAVHIRNALASNPERAPQIGTILNWIDTVCSQTTDRGDQHKTVDLELKSYGVIKSIHHTGKFGFISQDSGESIFFHVNRIHINRRELSIGRKVQFELSFDWRGRALADNVHILNE